MKRVSSGGTRLFSYREGDRSEYLAIYALTRIAFVTPVPRQEDFGVIDFRCVLARKEGRHVRPEGSFSVQVKSSGSSLRLNSGQIRWISTNMDCPLFICLVDKAGENIRLYSCANLWTALFLRMDPHSITLIMGRYGPNGERYIHHPGDTEDAIADREGKFDVFLGPPIIDRKLRDFQESADSVHAVLREWIALDRFNAASMRFGRAVTCEFESASTNEIPTKVKVQSILKRSHNTVNEHGLVEKIIPLLKSLMDSYGDLGQESLASQIDELVNAFTRDLQALPEAAVNRLLD